MLAGTAGVVWRPERSSLHGPVWVETAGSSGFGLTIVVTGQQDYVYVMFSRFKKPAICLVSVGVLAAPLAPDLDDWLYHSPIDDAFPVTVGSTATSSPSTEIVIQNTITGDLIAVSDDERVRYGLSDDEDTDRQSPMRWSRIIITDPSSGSVPSS